MQDWASDTYSAVEEEDYEDYQEEVVRDFVGPNEAVSPLYTASATGDVAEVRRLCTQADAVDVNEANGACGATAMHAACRFNHPEVVQLLHTFGADVNAAQTRGNRLTPLIIACSLGHTPIVELLFRFGARPNTTALDGSAPLHEACENGHAACAELLLIAGVNFDAVTYSGCTPLSIASRAGHADIVELLLTCNADASTRRRSEALNAACEGGHTKVVELLLRAGAGAASDIQDGFKAPLLIACQRGAADVVELLLKAGANVHAESTNGDTPLHIASERGNTRVAELLLTFGAKVDAVRDIDSYSCGGMPMHMFGFDYGELMMGFDTFDSPPSAPTPLFAACRRGHALMVELLVRFGADVNGRVDDETPLHAACIEGNVQVVEVLLRSGADLHAKAHKRTPLLAACGEGHADVVDVLLKAGAISKGDAYEGVAALHAACRECHADVVEVLLKAGVNVNAIARNGKTPLHAACSYGGGLGVIRLLHRFGADLNLTDLEGKTALHTACFRLQLEAAELLLSLFGSSVGCAESLCGEQPFHIACSKGHRGLIRLLMRHGVSESGCDDRFSPAQASSTTRPPRVPRDVETEELQQPKRRQPSRDRM